MNQLTKGLQRQESELKMDLNGNVRVFENIRPLENDCMLEEKKKVISV